MSNYIDKEFVRKSLKDLAIAEPDFVTALLAEIDNDLKKAKQKRLNQIIDEDFEEYKEVFKALA